MGGCPASSVDKREQGGTRRFLLEFRICAQLFLGRACTQKCGGFLDFLNANAVGVDARQKDAINALSALQTSTTPEERQNRDRTKENLCRIPVHTLQRAKKKNP